MISPAHVQVFSDDELSSLVNLLPITSETPPEALETLSREDKIKRINEAAFIQYQTDKKAYSARVKGIERGLATAEKDNDAEKIAQLTGQLKALEQTKPQEPPTMQLFYQNFTIEGLLKSLTCWPYGIINSSEAGQEWLFPSDTAKSGHFESIERPFRRVVKAVGLDPSRVLRHTLRHTAITHLVQAGVDLPTVKRISGHKSLQMVERYAHQNMDHVQQAFGKLRERYQG